VLELKLVSKGMPLVRADLGIDQEEIKVDGHRSN
jgi:hypothetical protein